MCCSSWKVAGRVSMYVQMRSDVWYFPQLPTLIHPTHKGHKLESKEACMTSIYFTKAQDDLWRLKILPMLRSEVVQAFCHRWLMDSPTAQASWGEPSLLNWRCNWSRVEAIEPARFVQMLYFSSGMARSGTSTSIDMSTDGGNCTKLTFAKSASISTRNTLEEEYFMVKRTGMFDNVW